MGTLQLVSPTLTSITGILPLPFAITSELKLTFMPEPVATSLLGCGALALVGLHAYRRRRG